MHVFLSSNVYLFMTPQQKPTTAATCNSVLQFGGMDTSL